MTLTERIKALNLPFGQYVVFGSSVLSVLGIRESNDIDISVLPELHETLRKTGEWQEVEHFGKVLLKKERIDIAPELSWDAYPTTTQQAIDSAMIIDGVPFLNLYELRKYKTARNRSKDNADIALIDAYLTTKTPTFPSRR